MEFRERSVVRQEGHPYLVLLVSKAFRFSRTIAGEVPTGWHSACGHHELLKASLNKSKCVVQRPRLVPPSWNRWALRCIYYPHGHEGCHGKQLP